MDNAQPLQIEDLIKIAERLDASMTAKEAAKFLGVGINELNRYANNGLPFYKMGNGRKFKKEDLIAFREKFRVVVKF